ncbi:MAG: hypothetical protein ACFFB2_12005 [Promethearchaeota archaeon]
MSTEQNDKISEIQDQKIKIESENTQIQQRVLNFQKESKKAVESFTSSLNQSKSKTLSEINLLMDNIDNLTKELEDYKKRTLVSEKGALSSRLDGLLGQVNSSIEGLQKSVIELSTKQEEDVSTIYSQMGRKINTGLSDIYSNQRAQITEFEKSISSKLAQIQRDIVSTVESESANQREMTENIATYFLESLDDFQSKIRDLSDSKETNVDAIFTSTVSESVGRLEIAKEDLLASIDGVMNNLEESLSNQKSTNEQMQSAIKDLITKTKSDVKTRIENQLLESREDWKTIQDTEIESLSSVKETTIGSFQKALETSELSQNNLLAELENQLKTNLYNEIDNITLSFTKFQDSIINQIDALISRLTSARDEMRESLSSLLVSNLNKIGGIGKQLEQHLSGVLSQISDEYENSRESIYTSLIAAIEERFSKIVTSLEQYTTTTNSKLQKTATDLDVSLLDFFDSTQKNISETVDKNSSTLNQLRNTVNESFRTLQAGQEKNIETTLTDVRAALRTKQSELVTTISSISPAAEDHIESNREYIEGKKSEISRTSSTAFDDLRKQAIAIEQDGMTTIHSIVGETNQKLDESISISEQSTKELIEGLEDEHKLSVAKFRSNSTQELDKHLETLTEYQNNLQEKFTKFFDNQQQSLDLFVNANRKGREAIDDQRRNLDVKFEEINNSIETAADSLSMNITTNTGNVTTSVKQVLKDVNDVIKTIK